MDAKADAFVEEEFMWCLDHDARAVPCIVFAAAGSAMLHVFEDGQGVGDDLVGLVAFDIDDESDAACIMFERGRI